MNEDYSNTLAVFSSFESVFTISPKPLNVMLERIRDAVFFGVFCDVRTHVF